MIKTAQALGPPEKYNPTTHAILPSAGYGGRHPKPTPHTFARFEAVASDSLKYSMEHGPRSTKPAYALIYKCDETGAERRWGLM